MKKAKLSIKDIASKFNISKTTVSFILNGKAKEKRISDKLATKVLNYTEEVGYKPNQLAQSLRTGKTKILGLMIEDISNPFFASIAKYIEEEAYKNGYKIIYCSTENDKKRAKDFLKMFYNLGVDGYILTPPNGIEEDIKRLIQSGENVILIDRHFDSISTDYVMVNNEESTYEGTLHLIKQGYRHIAFITVALEQPQMLGRLRGYKSAMEENNLAPHIHSLPFLSDYRKFSDEIIKVLKKESTLDALFFGVNYLGVSGLEALAKMNLKTPEDLAVISFDDNDLFRVNSPTITAISQPLEKISETVITTLLKRINSSASEREDRKGVFLPTTLVVRESTLKKAGASPLVSSKQM